jgi:hypothetical protein
MAYIVQSMTQTHEHVATIIVFCMMTINLTLTVALATALKEFQLAGSAKALESTVTAGRIRS